MSIETFISYARKDGLTHAEYLERALPDTWRDKRNLDPFKDFTAEIERAIDACRQVVAVITPDTTREDSFVRRELARAVRKKKPVIVLRFDDIDPPIIVETHTWLDWFKLGWDATLNHIREWMGAFVPSYSPPALADALAADPHREYVETLYDSIVDYLDRVIIKEVALKTTHTADAVAKSKPALLGGFYRRAGLNASEERIETLQEGLEHFKGRLLLLGEPGAGKTVSVLATARDAVVRRLNNPAAPLPILLRCAEWPSDPPMPLPDWVREQVGLTVTTFNDAFVFFDGFDELGTSRTRKVKDDEGKEFEESYDPRLPFLDIIPKDGRVLLSCRIKEYEDFSTKVELNGAVTLRPLTETQIHEYLADLPDLWDALSSDAELLEVMKTPLLLSLFAFGYKDAPDAAKALRDLNAAELSEAIFKQYVQKRYKHELLRFKELGQKPPFRLKALYNTLGYVGMVNTSGGYSVKENILPRDDFQETLHDETLVKNFIKFTTLLNFVVIKSPPVDVGFIHIRLRNHFVYTYCLSHINDEKYYTKRYSPPRALSFLPYKEEKIVTLIASQYKHKSVIVRREVVKALGKIGDPRAMEVLLSALEDTDVEVRSNVVEALDKIGDKESINALFTLLEDSNQKVRYTAAIVLDKNNLNPSSLREEINLAFALQDWPAIISIGSPVVDRVIRISYSANENDKRSAIWALGRIGDIRALNRIIETLTDADSKTRHRAAEALGNMGNTHAIKYLVQTLHDSDSDVRSIAAEELTKYEWHPKTELQQIALAVAKQDWQQLISIGTASVLSLISLLDDNNVNIRAAVVNALGEIGDSRAVEPLIQVHEKYANIYESDTNIRSIIVEALTKIDDPRAANFISEIKENDLVSVWDDDF